VSSLATPADRASLTERYLCAMLQFI